MSRTYICIETGNDVEVVQAGHGGTLMESMQSFKAGDFIVTYPVDLMGEQIRKAIDEKEFAKLYKIKKGVRSSDGQDNETINGYKLQR